MIPQPPPAPPPLPEPPPAPEEGVLRLLANAMEPWGRRECRPLRRLLIPPDELAWLLETHLERESGFRDA